jgi:hypothetical protein
MPQQENINNLLDLNAQLPRTTVTALIKEVDQKPSQRGACMDQFKLEIVAPESIPFEGQNVVVAGRPFNFYVSYSAAARRRSIMELRSKLNLEIGDVYTVPSEEEIRAGAYTTIPEVQELTKSVVGLGIEIEISTEPMYKTDTGRWDGKPVLDESGQKIVTGHRIVADVAQVKSPPRPLDGLGPAM